jgi:hypothetical protein
LEAILKEFSQVKIEIFIPEEFVSVLREEISKAGAGIIGHYDHCTSVTEVRGYWRPLQGANPFGGKIGEIIEGRECKVEVNCPRETVSKVIKAIRSVHPYEEAAHQYYFPGQRYLLISGIQPD